MAMRVWVPLPDWLVIGAVVAVSIASLTFIAIGLGWRRRRKNDDDGYEEHQEAEQIPILLKIAVILLALAPGAMMAGAIFWLSQSSLLPAPAGSVGGSRFEEHQAIDDAPLRPASSVTTGLIGTLALLTGIGSDLRRQPDEGVHDARPNRQGGDREGDPEEVPRHAQRDGKPSRHGRRLLHREGGGAGRRDDVPDADDSREAIYSRMEGE